MAVIAFSKDPNEGLVYAGWVIRQVLDDTLAQNPNDAEMAAAFALAKESFGIVVYALQPDLAARVTKAMRDTATGILEGTIRSGILDKGWGDARTVEQYRGVLAEVLKAIASTDELRA